MLFFRLTFSKENAAGVGFFKGGMMDETSRTPDSPAAASLLSRDRASVAEGDFGDTAGGSEKS